MGYLLSPDDHASRLDDSKLKTRKCCSLGFLCPALLGAGSAFEEGCEVFFHLAWIEKTGWVELGAIARGKINFRQSRRLGCV
jgi:hypothetical protein